jgi:general secretion pathway protein C
MDVILKKYFWVVNLLVIALCSGFAGRAASHLIEGAYLTGEDARTPARRPQPYQAPKTRTKDADAIIKRNIFCSACAPIVTASSKNEAGGPQSNEPQKTSLQLELVSTMVCPDDDAWSMAILRDLSTKEKDPAMFARGALVFHTGATVVRVLQRRVYLRNAGRLEYVEMDMSTPAPAAAPVAALNPPPSGPADPSDVSDKEVHCTGNSCTVERALVERMLNNTAALATAARFVPSIKDGKPNGFKLYAIRPSSIFGKIGLQNGDTLKAINGNEMSSPDKALEVYTKVRNASHLSVQVERRGENITLDYTIR